MATHTIKETPIELGRLSHHNQIRRLHNLLQANGLRDAATTIHHNFHFSQWATFLVSFSINNCTFRAAIENCVIRRSKKKKKNSAHDLRFVC